MLGHQEALAELEANRIYEQYIKDKFVYQDPVNWYRPENVSMNQRDLEKLITAIKEAILRGVDA